MANATADPVACACDIAGVPGLPVAAGNISEPISLKLLSINWRLKGLTDFIIKDFEASKDGQVKIDTSPSRDISSFDELFDEIEQVSRLELEMFDLYYTPPTVMGSVAPYGGFADMTEFITEHFLSEWLDILLGYRDFISTYENKILMMPLDGDMLHLYYNKEILEYYSFDPPRTWDEYNSIAEKVHGEVFPPTNKTLIGSCVGRKPQCAAAYWAVLVLSSMTQTKGTFEGSLFDSKDTAPLTDDAFLEMLRIFEQQVKYGHEEEFNECIGLNIASMNGTYVKPNDSDGIADEEQCVLTYNWGNSFADDVIRGNLGILKTPGSQNVLDRETGKLVPCDKERCPHATYYDDIGFVNHVPYAAFGGWAGAVSANAPKEKQALALEFLAFAASKAVSSKSTIRGLQDPFRKSHLDLEAFVSNGYDRETVQVYLTSVAEGLQSPNLAIDIRFPLATKLMSTFDSHIFKHLNETKGESDEGLLKSKRSEALNAVNREFKKIISDYNARGDTEITIREQYQRLRGVYVSENENRHLKSAIIRSVGWALGGAVILTAIAFAFWVVRNRKHKVVKMSQPMFLLIICLGVVVLSSAVFPLGIDDGISSASGCDMACASIPWLLSTGLTLVFAALFSKLWRINRVMRAATACRRVVVTERDVIRPFAVLMTLNFILLLSWTLVDPLRYKRIYSDELNSYGRCVADGMAWKGFIATLAALNFFALVIANVQAYMARGINDELSESKYIGLTTLSMLQIFIVGFPLLVIVYDNPSAYFFVAIGLIFICSSSILLLIFVPKLLNARSFVARNTRSSVARNTMTVGYSFQAPNNSAISQENLVALKDTIFEEHQIDITPIISMVQRS